METSCTLAIGKFITIESDLNVHLYALVAAYRISSVSSNVYTV